MQTTRGQILSIRSDCSAATVAVDPAEFCARCASGKGCGAGLIGSNRNARQFEAPIVGRIDLHEGDEVRIELAPQNVLRAALEVYGAPLVGVLTMVAIAQFAGLSDWPAAAAAGLGLVLGGITSRYRLRRASCLRQFTPVITGRLVGAE